MSKATVEQVKREIENLSRRLKETKAEAKAHKQEWGAASSGGKETKAAWTKTMDQIDDVRSGLKQDRQALFILINENEHLHELKPLMQELMGL